jgi:hypothetical protein
MPIEWDSPAPLDTQLQNILGDWLVHVKGGRNPARDNYDTESDPVQFEEEDFEDFETFLLDRHAIHLNDARRTDLENAIGFCAWTSAM